MIKNLALDTKNFIAIIKAASEKQHVTDIKFKAYGNSMFPFIKNQDILNVKLINNDYNIHIGDIVAVTDQTVKIIMVHRIVGIKNKLYLIKGDNQVKADDWFPKKSILGIITEAKRTSGKIFYCHRWQNILIAFLSKTNILKKIILPISLNIKKIFEKLHNEE